MSTLKTPARAEAQATRTSSGTATTKPGQTGQQSNVPVTEVPIRRLPESIRPTVTSPNTMVGPQLAPSAAAAVGEVQRGPNEGRVERRRGARAGKKTRRGPKQTAYQRRYLATRPMGKHPRLRAWDMLPLDVRSSYAGQERRIFRSSGLLVTRFDFSLHQTLSDFSVGELKRAFPVAPLWWPLDWGHLPITLPWEVSLYRTDLVRASPDDVVWKEVYQLFLEQLAAGFDLHWNAVKNASEMRALPSALARAILDAGGFAFCEGTGSATSYRKFLELHPMVAGNPPDQRTAKASAWLQIGSLRSASVNPNIRTTTPLCQCGEQISRAVRRLGIDAQVLEAVRTDEIEEMGSSATKVAALAGSAMTYALNADKVLDRVDAILSTTTEYLPRAIALAQEAVRGLRGLGEALPARFRVNLSHLE